MAQAYVFFNEYLNECGLWFRGKRIGLFGLVLEPKLGSHKHKNKHLLKIQSLAINMFGVIFINSLLSKLYDYSCVLFKFK